LNPNNKSKSKALLVPKQTDKSKIKFESHGVCYLHDWTKKKSKLRTFEKRVSNFHSNPDSKNRPGFKTKNFPFQISNQLNKPKSRWKIIKFEGKKRNLLPGWPYNKINKLLHSISLLLVSLL
jgi:hypothetical protein